MSIVPQSGPRHFLNFSQLANAYSSERGWKLIKWGVNKGVTYVRLRRKGYWYTLTGGLALAWLEQENYFGDKSND